MVSEICDSVKETYGKAKRTEAEDARIDDDMTCNASSEAKRSTVGDRRRAFFLEFDAGLTHCGPLHQH